MIDKTKTASLILLCGLIAAAAEQATVVSGKVTDRAGGTIPGAKIALTDVESGRIREARTDRDGRYRLTEVPPGKYKLTAEYPGFQRLQRELAIASATPRSVDMVLEVGRIFETITVAEGWTPARCRPATKPGLARHSRLRSRA